jgi:RHS repeat-associated protein
VNLPTSNSYDADGNLGREVLPNGVTDTYTYDTLNRLMTNTSTGPTGQIYQDQYTLNPDGTRAEDVVSQAEPGGATLGLDITWGYDNDQRLITNTYSDSGGSYDFDPSPYFASYNYTYDLAGNRVSETSDQGLDSPTTNTYYTYNHDNQLTVQTITSGSNIITTTNTYDANGSLSNAYTTSNGGTSYTTDTYTYDLRNKMVAFATNGTAAASYVYDDAGNRVREITGGTTNYYLTDIQNPTGYAQPIEVWTQAPSTRSGQVPQMTYMVGMRVLGQFGPTGTAYYYTTDGHGSVVATTDSTGNLQSTFDYDAFGDPILFTPSSTTPIYLFGGDAVYDPVSGLYMNGDGVRDRQASTGDFIEADTQGNGSNEDPISLHKYLYANADPINMDDPSGHDSYPYTSTNGIAAHLLFAAYMLTKGVTLPDLPLGVVLPNDFPVGSPFAGLTTDAVNTNTKRYYDLKPVTHIGSGTLQGFDSIQMSLYDSALAPLGYSRGSFSDVASDPMGTPIGYIVGDRGETLAMTLYPQNDPMSPSGLNGAGFILYGLTPVPNVFVPVPVPQTRPSLRPIRVVSQPGSIALPLSAIEGAGVAAGAAALGYFYGPAAATAVIQGGAYVGGLLLDLGIAVLNGTTGGVA